MPTSVRGRKIKSRFLWRSSRTILYREVVSFHANPWKGDSSWADSRGGGGRESGPPWKITKNRVSKHTSPVPLKITKLPSQHSMLGHQSAKRHLNGVSLAGQWWLAYRSSLPSSTKKKTLSKLSAYFFRPHCFENTRAWTSICHTFGNTLWYILVPTIWILICTWPYVGS